MKRPEGRVRGGPWRARGLEVPGTAGFATVRRHKCRAPGGPRRIEKIGGAVKRGFCHDEAS